MSDVEQARAYASADFSEPHERFVRLLRERLPRLPDAGTAADLGCGPCDVALRFLRAYPGWRVDGVDGSAAMLAEARRAAAREGIAARVRLLELRLPAPPPDARYELLFSNSLLHHLSDPSVLWTTLRLWGSPGAAVFVMDLRRPASREDAESLVQRYAAGEPDVLRHDFHCSLLAAYRCDEVARQLAASELPQLHVEQVSDRHLVVYGRMKA